MLPLSDNSGYFKFQGNRTGASGYWKGMEQIGKKRIYETLAKRFGHTEFRPLQYQLIRHTLAGGNRIAVMGTGAGKSLCYLLPAVLLSGTTLVVSPLISLMRDQHRRSRRAGMRSVLLGEAKGGGRATECGYRFHLTGTAVHGPCPQIALRSEDKSSGH